MTPYQIEREAEAAGCSRCAEARRLFAVQFPSLTRASFSDHGQDFCAAQSIETHGPATYNHPKGYVQVRVSK